MTAGRAARAYYRCDRVLGAGFRAVRGVFDGCWLGALSRAQLADIDALYYDRATEYHDAEYNRGGLFGWEQRAIERHFTGASSLVVTSAGGGREVLALAKAGFAVTGFEPHAGLALAGNRLLAAEGVPATVRPCPRDGWPVDSPEADGAVVGWSGYMLTPTRARRVAFLRAAAAALPADAPLLLSFATVERRDVRLRVTAAVGAPLRRLLRREPVEPGDALIPNLVHFFTRDELAGELADGGFELIDYGTTDYGWAVGRVRPRKDEE